MDLTTLVNGIPLYWYVLFAVGFMALVSWLLWRLEQKPRGYRDVTTAGNPTRKRSWGQ